MRVVLFRVTLKLLGKAGCYFGFAYLKLLQIYLLKFTFSSKNLNEEYLYFGYKIKNKLKLGSFTPPPPPTSKYLTKWGSQIDWTCV